MMQCIAFPDIDIPCIHRRRNNIEITAKQDRPSACIKCTRMVGKPLHPVELVGEFLVDMALIVMHGVTIRQIEPGDCHSGDINFEIARLFIGRITVWMGQARADIINIDTAGDGDTVIGFLAMGMNLVPGSFKQRMGEVFIHGFCFLHHQDIGITSLQPGDHLFAAHLNGIHIPAGNFDRVRWQRTSHSRKMRWHWDC